MHIAWNTSGHTAAHWQLGTRCEGQDHVWPAYQHPAWGKPVATPRYTDTCSANVRNGWWLRRQRA